MKVFVILESYTDCKGGNATSFGVFKTKENAIKALPDAIIERLGFESIEEFEDYNDISFADNWIKNGEHWMWDRDDDLIEFYIQGDELEDEKHKIMTPKVKELFDIVTKVFEGYLEFTTKGNEPVLMPENIIIDVESGVTRFANLPFPETFAWDDLTDDDVDFILDEVVELEKA